ncbi:hypothetical protein [Streptococcus pyogenes]|uniref:hypothetical protein n=1 Tax=Streptococcus pyogenes TaxID=1314 RepID=UPI000A41488D|nr:hypothetical protein [Streptococcus pyogenes]
MTKELLAKLFKCAPDTGTGSEGVSDVDNQQNDTDGESLAVMALRLRNLNQSWIVTQIKLFKKLWKISAKTKLSVLMTL